MSSSKEVRIFVDCHVLDGEFQGTRTYIEGLYKVLIKNKDLHFYLAANDVNNLEKIFGTHSNVTFVKYRTKSKILRLLIDSPLLILKHKINFAHFQYRVPPIKCCHYIVTIHDVLFEDYPQYFPKINRRVSYITYKASAKLSDIVLTVSPYSKDRISEHLGIKDAYITPNGIAPEFFEDYNKKTIQQEVANTFKISNYIIYISRWEPRKNHHLLAKAFVNRELYKKHTLLFIGNVTFKNNEYDAYYNGLPQQVKEKIISLNNINFKDALLLLRGSEASVYPAIAEGFGIPPLEAIAARIPTIASNATAMADYSDFMGKYQFNPNNLQQFEEQLQNLLQEDHTVNFYAMQHIIKQRYNWENAAAVFMQALANFGKK